MRGDATSRVGRHEQPPLVVVVIGRCAQVTLAKSDWDLDRASAAMLSALQVTVVFRLFKSSFVCPALQR